jgi:hypothetical protein
MSNRSRPRRLSQTVLAVSLFLASAQMLGTAQAAPWVMFPAPDVAQGQTTLTQVNFGGHEWIVAGTPTAAGTNNNGLKSPAGTLTLLLKDGDSGYGNTPFRNIGTDPIIGGQDESSYLGSTLQKAMESAANGLSTKEQGVISTRTLTAADDTNWPITGGDVPDQRFWARGP